MAKFGVTTSELKRAIINEVLGTVQVPTEDWNR